MTKSPKLNLLALFPVVFMLVSIVSLHFFRIDQSFESDLALVISNLIFCSSMAFLIAYLAARSYLISNDFSLVFIGSAMLIWGLSAGIAGTFVSKNSQVTMHNTGVLLSGLLLLTGAISLFSSSHPKQSHKPSDHLLAFFYVGSGLIFLFVVWLVGHNLLPEFFIIGQGPTMIRQIVLGAGIAEFGISALLFWMLYKKLKKGFVYYYFIGITLLAIGFFGVWLRTSSLGSLLSWTSRFAQFLAGAYILMAVISLKRETGAYLIFLNEELREVRQELSRANSQIKILLEQAPVGFAYFDRNLRFLLINEWLAKINGFSVEEHIGKHIKDIAPSLLPAAERIAGQVIKTGEAVRDQEFSGDTRLLPGQKRYWKESWYPVRDVKGNITGLGVFVEEITDQKRMLAARQESEQALRESHALYSTLAANIPGGAVFILDRELRYVLAKGQALTEAGLTSGGVEGRTIWEVLNSENASRYEPYFRMGFKGESFEYEHEGHGRYYLNKGVPIFDQSGTVSQLVVISYDITQRKLAEDVLRRDKQALERFVDDKSRELLQAGIKLEQSKRLSDIGVLAATVAHELRNPLAGIKIACYNIERKISDLRISKNLKSINRKVLESEKIIDSLLFYSRLRPPQFKTIKPYFVLSECIELSRKSLAGKVKVTLAEDDNLKSCKIEADPFQLREVFLNILNNACDAVDKQTGQVSIKLDVTGDMFKAGFHDNGRGIERDYIDMVCDPFFTTKAKGTGLGLSVCQHIVKLHNGLLAISSEIGLGTVVTVALPFKQA